MGPRDELKNGRGRVWGHPLIIIIGFSLFLYLSTSFRVLVFMVLLFLSSYVFFVRLPPSLSFFCHFSFSSSFFFFFSLSLSISLSLSFCFSFPFPSLLKFSRLSVCLSVCLVGWSGCLSDCLSIYLSIYLSVNVSSALKMC